MFSHSYHFPVAMLLGKFSVLGTEFVCVTFSNFQCSNVFFFSESGKQKTDRFNFREDCFGYERDQPNDGESR